MTDFHFHSDLPLFYCMLPANISLGILGLFISQRQTQNDKRRVRDLTDENDRCYRKPQSSGLPNMGDSSSNVNATAKRRLANDNFDHFWPIFRFFSPFLAFLAIYIYNHLSHFEP